jgi:hypothetical protein
MTSFRLRKLLIVPCAVLSSFSCATNSAVSIGGKALDRFNEFIIGATVANACDPSFKWETSSKRAEKIGKDAFEEIVNRMRVDSPNDPRNRTKANDALQTQTEELTRLGARIVAENGCGHPEVQGRLQKFKAEFE